jgi:thiosulfate/3-mercaptopyruvate sulfurtransferase
LSSELTGTQVSTYSQAMPVWRQVLVDEAFLDDVHAQPGCISCHGGTPNTVDFADAHSGLRSPDRQPDKTCGSCHIGVAKQGRTSLHHLQWGIQKALAERGADLTDPTTAKAYAKQCTTCHASCGDCHVSRTRQAGGGLAAGHGFSATGFDTNACTSCHGETVGAESAGIQSAKGDYHAALGMSCTSCHTTATTFHSGSPGVGMLDGRPEPTCLDCHPEAAKRSRDNMQHAIHNETVQCQVCHASGPYRSFDDYAALGKTDAISDTLAFKIGRNPVQSDQRPWNYVLLREVPITADTFAKSGSGLVPGIGDAPSWTLATPHNMQRNTPQNASCNACHGQKSLFLTADDLPAAAVEANRSVIVPKVPTTRLEVPQ